jgi:hypothetical protein
MLVAAQTPKSLIRMIALIKRRAECSGLSISYRCVSKGPTEANGDAPVLSRCGSRTGRSKGAHVPPINMTIASAEQKERYDNCPIFLSRSY